MAGKKKAPDPRFGESFSFGDIVKWTNATRTNLIHWTSTGIIRPDVEDTLGTGHPRRFSPLNFAEAQLAVQINQLRVPGKLISRALDHFRTFHELAVALRDATPDQDMLTDEQRARARSVWVRAFLMRDQRWAREHGKAVKTSAKTYSIDASWQSFAPEVEREMLNDARLWRALVTDATLRDQGFCALVITPPGYDRDGEGEVNIVYDKNFNPSEAIPLAAVVVNLGALVDYVQMVSNERLTV